MKCPHNGAGLLQTATAQHNRRFPLAGIGFKGMSRAFLPLACQPRDFAEKSPCPIDAFRAAVYTGAMFEKSHCSAERLPRIFDFSRAALLTKKFFLVD
jgi:hypothetical protein